MSSVTCAAVPSLDFRGLARVPDEASFRCRCVNDGAWHGPFSYNARLSFALPAQAASRPRRRSSVVACPGVPTHFRSGSPSGRAAPNRSTRTLNLTEEGLAYVEFCERSLEEIEIERNARSREQVRFRLERLTSPHLNLSAPCTWLKPSLLSRSQNRVFACHSR